MKHENAWIIFCFLVVSIFYIVFAVLLILIPFLWGYKLFTEPNEKIRDIVFLINYIAYAPPIILFIIHRIINDFNVTVRLSKKFRYQDIRFKNKDKNTIIYLIYRHIYLKPLNIKHNEIQHRDKKHNMTKIKIQIYFFFYLTLLIWITTLITNIRYTSWYIIYYQGTDYYKWWFWIMELISVIAYVFFWKGRTFHYCRNNNLTTEMFKDERLIRWVIKVFGGWPYKHFILCRNAFHWDEKFGYNCDVFDVWLFYKWY
ncbi:hypothetical protein SAMN02745154_00532 [Mycoplasmopsis verecunda]|uniref:Uncharacterized protein n=1 Tax=Mycoplasmopsis verecunda TaxID=171291 RepID=A0A1T4LTF4_9BACT|nr:hypothetical protein SAMN02745154_00532 [Mycoplasmopsis verecunda]